MKTEETIRLEQAIKEKYCTPWQFGIHEVTLGFGGRERADFMTISTNDVVRCFEIKVSMSDLHSKAKLTFCGHYNYLVAPYDIAAAAMEMLPSHVGILYGNRLEPLRNPSLMEVSPEMLSIIKSSLIRSLSREVRKGDPTYYNDVARRLSHTQKSLDKLRTKDRTLNNIIHALEAPNPEELEDIEAYYESITGKKLAY